MITFEEYFGHIIRQVIREELAAIKQGRQAGEDDRLMSAAEAARLLQVSKGFLYKHAATLPYAVRLDRNVVRFSYKKIQEEIQRKLKAQASEG